MFARVYFAGAELLDFTGKTQRADGETAKKQRQSGERLCFVLCGKQDDEEDGDRAKQPPRGRPQKEMRIGKGDSERKKRRREQSGTEIESFSVPLLIGGA